MMKKLFQRLTSSPVRGDVYLIHLDRPLDEGGNQHYMGFTTHLPSRMQLHGAGQGSRFMAVAEERGIPWRVVRVWRNVPRELERKLKNRKEGPTLCPICSPERAMTNATEGNAYLVEDFDEN